MAGGTLQNTNGMAGLPAASGKSIAESTVEGKGGGRQVAPVSKPSLLNSTPPKYQNSGLARFVGNMDPYQPPAQPPQTFAPPYMPNGLYGKPPSSSTGSSSGGGLFSSEGGGMGSGGGTPADTNVSGYIGSYMGQPVNVTPGFFGIGGEGFVGEYSKDPAGYSGIAGQGDIGYDAGYSGYDSSNYGGGDRGGSNSDNGGQQGDASDAGVGGGGLAKGGMVTKARLLGPNPKGKDDGYGALDVGEAVIPARMVRKLGKKKVRKLIGRKK